MRVWIVNPFDNLPLEGYRKERYWLMAEAFVRAGHQVTYWTQNFSHANKTQRKLRFQDSNSLFDLRILPVPTYPTNLCLRRVWSHFVWSRRLAMVFRAERKLPQLIVVSSPPLLQGCTVRRFAAAHGIPYVLDVMDAWPETFERLGRIFRITGIGTVMRRIVQANYGGAAIVTCVAQRYAEMVQRDYGVTVPTHVFHHGIEQIASPVDSSPHNHESIRLAYVGNMSLSYDLSTLIEAVKRETAFTLELAGKGPDEQLLRRQASNCERIVFHGYLDASSLSSLLARSDIGMVPMFDESCVGVPYKLADYAAAALPIVSSLHGETEALLKEYAAGITYQSGNIESLIKAVKSIELKSATQGAIRLAKRFEATLLYDTYVIAVSSC